MRLTRHFLTDFGMIGICVEVGPSQGLEAVPICRGSELVSPAEARLLPAVRDVIGYHPASTGGTKMAYTPMRHKVLDTKSLGDNWGMVLQDMIEGEATKRAHAIL
jgi:hypothetical protein